MRIFHRMTGLMAVNTYLLLSDAGDCALIDPVGDTDALLKWLSDKGGRLTHILLTHGHFDHIGAVDALREMTGAKLYVHEGDGDMIGNPQLNASSFFGKPIQLQPADVLLHDCDRLDIGGETVTVVHTPGHTPGGVCYVTEDAVFSGDTLFYRSIGRSDFLGGSETQLLQSIKTRLFTLANRTVYPGHGKRTTLMEERQQNPNVGGEA